MSDESTRDNLDVRLSVTETKVDNIGCDLADQKAVFRDIAAKVDGLKERFDKMNGAIPHIQATCNNIERHLESGIEINNTHEAKITKNSTYIKIMLGILAPVVVGIAGALIKIFIA